MVQDVDSQNGISFPQPNEGEKVVVKFKQEAGIRLSASGFTAKSQGDAAMLRTTLDQFADIKVERTFAETEDVLETQVSRLAAQTGASVPTLSGYYHITTADKAQSQALVTELEKNPMVDAVYYEPPAVPALYVEPTSSVEDEALPATPDYIARQGYLTPATDGVDAKFAWTQAGGKGDQVQVIDIEGAWNFSHEDLLLNQGGVVGGTPTGDLSWENHGTAVHGEIGGDENNLGIVGIAPKTKFSAVSIFGQGNSPAKAIKTAADRLQPGDIILIELHRQGPGASGQGQDGFIPIEWWPADFDATKYATSKGVIVIAAAGNGARNLDDAIYQQRFDRSVKDSGSLLVGAGAPPSGNHGPDRSRLGFSNYGASVDAQGWGREVTTAGYGDLQASSDKNKRYTAEFSGTSSSAPIVVGAAACLQSIAKTANNTVLGYLQMREVMRNTGSPQTDATGRPKSQRIGKRPDLKAAVEYLSLGQSGSGIATKYWNECVAYPAGSTVSLWLYVNGWKNLDNPSDGIKDMVQRAFLGSGSRVRIWYEDAKVVGLVVEGS